MSIILSTVSQHSTILAEASLQPDNCDEIIQHIFSKLPEYDCKMSFVHNRHMFHCLVKDNITFLCMANDSIGTIEPRNLNQVSIKFDQKYGNRCIEPVSFGLNEFSKDLKELMIQFNNPESDAFRKVQGDLDQVKDIMVENIEKVLERGERISILLDRTDTLNQTSLQFRQQSAELRRKMWWKNKKVVGVAVLIILLLGIAAFIALIGIPAEARS